jgi:hypothetical protein
MKTVIYSLLTAIFIVCSVYAEQKNTSSPIAQYPKKVYVDTAKNRIYWPLEKEVYVRLAESADKSAPSYILSTDEGSGAAKGLKLDVSGRQSLRWINAITNETVNLRFYADGEPPACKIKLDGAPSYINPNPIRVPSDSSGVKEKTFLPPNVSFYGKGLELQIESEDRHSGVDAVYLSINNSAYKRLNGKMAISEENIYDVACFGADRVGNTSIPQTSRFVVDLTPPVSEALSDKGRDSIFTRSEGMIINAKDNLSGVKETFYRFNNDISFTPYRNYVSLRKLDDGKHTIFFYSTDNVGNVEEIKSMTFSIDDKAPQPEMVYSGDFFVQSEKVKYISPRTRVKVNAQDNMSGVSGIEYSIDGAAYKKYTEPFTLLPMDGKRSVSVRASDRKGNLSQIIRTYVFMDAKPPRCKYEISGPQLEKNGAVCITPETRILLSARDDASGVKSIQYQIGNEPPVDYSGSFNIDKEGLMIIKYWGKDNVNNVTDAQSITILVDKTPPEIVETFSVVGQGSPMKFPKSTSLFLAARDNSAGVNGIWYSINKASQEKYGGILKFEKPGNYTLDISSRDNVGNVSRKVLSFIVE